MSIFSRPSACKGQKKGNVLSVKFINAYQKTLNLIELYKVKSPNLSNIDLKIRVTFINHYPNSEEHLINLGTIRYMVIELSRITETKR